jgi:hypothetical protein
MGILVLEPDASLAQLLGELLQSTGVEVRLVPASRLSDLVLGGSWSTVLVDPWELAADSTKARSETLRRVLETLENVTTLVVLVSDHSRVAQAERAAAVARAC